jgi:arylsulfatase A-like enzyme
MKTLVLSVSGLNLAYAGSYGSDWSATPNLDALSARSVLFDHHYSDQPDAIGVRRAWRSGRYYFPTPENESKHPEETDLITLLAEQKIASAFVGAAQSSLYADKDSGWNIQEVVSHERGKHAFDKTLEGFGRVLERTARKDHWFAWISLPTLLPPWKIPVRYLEPYFQADAEADEEEGSDEVESEPIEPLLAPELGALDPTGDRAFERIQRTYAAAVGRLDELIGGLLTHLQERDPSNEVCVIFTAEYGLPLGEHGMVGLVRPWLHEELVHAPLIMRLPGDAEAGRRVSALTQPVDLLPTIADLHSVAIPAVHGRSLLPLARDEVEEVRGYACSGLRLDDGVEWALRTSQWAYLLPIANTKGDERRRAQLYVKPDDRWEVNDVIQHHPELVEHLEQVIRGFAANTEKEGPIESPVLRDVEALLQSQLQGDQGAPQES